MVFVFLSARLYLLFNMLLCEVWFFVHCVVGCVSLYGSCYVFVELFVVCGVFVKSFVLCKLKCCFC